MAKSWLMPVLLEFLGLFLAAAAAAATVDGQSIDELLAAHGLPAGIFPKVVNSFTLDRATGQLEVRLNQSCFAKYEGMAHFDQVVRGNLSYGELRGIVGLSQEEIFLWFPVKGIMKTDPPSGIILFDMGLAQKHLALSLFESPPECRPPERGAVALRGVGGGQEAAGM